MADRKTTTERGLGYEHVRIRRRLMAKHIDGTPCPCMQSGDCGRGCLCAKAGGPLPMYRDPNLNVDGMALEADHTTPRSEGGKRADRLMLASCNRSRGGAQFGKQQGQPVWWTRDWLGIAGLSADDL